MPKHASMSPAERPDQADVELDPIIWGLLDRVPAPGEPWPKQARGAWLNILSLTLDMLYPEQPASTAHPTNAPSTQHP